MCLILQNNNHMILKYFLNSIDCSFILVSLNGYFSNLEVIFLIFSNNKSFFIPFISIV